MIQILTCCQSTNKILKIIILKNNSLTSLKPCKLKLFLKLRFVQVIFDFMLEGKDSSIQFTKSLFSFLSSSPFFGSTSTGVLRRFLLDKKLEVDSSHNIGQAILICSCFNGPSIFDSLMFKF